nr:nucleotidyltransferase domain-containing protein [Haladaptatus halobius]
MDFVMMFGSHVTGTSRPSSDLDLAVKFIDISDIEPLPIDVAHNAVNGVFLCGDEEAFRQFKGFTTKQN